MKPDWLSEDQLTRLVTETIPAQLPEDHKNAVVMDVNEQGVGFVAGFSKDALKGTLQLDFAYQHTWQSDNLVGAKVIYSF